MFKNLLTATKDTTTREMKRMMSRPIYFLCTVVVMSFSYLFFLTFFNEGQPNKMPIAVVDFDNSALSRQYIRNLNATQQAFVTMHLNSHKEAREELQKGNIYAFVQIPYDFGQQVITNRRPKLIFYVNDAFLVSGSLLFKDISTMSAITSAGVQQQVLRAKGVAESSIKGIIQPITLDSHLIGNPWANYGTYLLNVILPGILQLMVLMMTVFPIGVELKERTSREWLKTANNSIFAAITGKLLPYTIIFTALGIVGNILLYKYMGFPLQSNIGWMFFTTFLYVLASQAIGVLLIGVTPVLRDGATLAGFFGMLGVTFAGSTFPIEQIPWALRIFSDLFPLHHYFNIYVNLALNGVEIKHSIIGFMILISFNILPIFVYHRLKNASINQHFPIK